MWIELKPRGSGKPFESCCVRTSFGILCSWIPETWGSLKQGEIHIFLAHSRHPIVFPCPKPSVISASLTALVRRAAGCILHIHVTFPSFSPEGMLGLTGLEESHHRVSDSSKAFLCNWHCTRSMSTSLQAGVPILPTVKELVKGLDSV